MLKPKTYDVADSNLANFGTELERNVKKAAAETEPAWANAGKELGLQIWRIEKFQVKSWPKEEYGSFFSGDSYICLYTYKQAGSDKVRFNVHFWLGSHTTQDEAGTAAYKTVELDTLLGDEPVQYREVQGYESDAFVKLFNGKITINEGGVDSGFRHVTPEAYKPRLLQLKGKRQVRAMQVSLVADSLNSGDAFVLDNGLKIFVWQGKAAGIFEKNKAGEMGRAIKDERAGKPELVVVSEGSESDEFWALLGGKPAGGVKSAAEGGDDAAAAAGFVKKLFRISDESGKLTFKEEVAGKVAKSNFDTKDAFVLDAGAVVFVWIGRGASPAEKKQGLQLAANYLRETGRPAHTTIARVFEGGENEEFNANLDA